MFNQALAWEISSRAPSQQGAKAKEEGAGGVLEGAQPLRGSAPRTPGGTE
ncbi:hypothetical protein GCM10022214_36210 [Actinomadura miaoliensis]|uniref:Uncharacterized protein n=1 Tax=Actinomadura miaoliensis TaxID=430685 RepID=A0ABP7VWS8_9ACTN